MANVRGLQTVTFAADAGAEYWLEIRPAVADYRVPDHRYFTHLLRLVVAPSLDYWLEVLGRCVSSGSLAADAARPLDALAGGFRVCVGRQVDANASNSRMSLPDCRLRSTNCTYWIDSRGEPRCPACRTVYRSGHIENEPSTSSQRSSPGEPLNLSLHTPPPTSFEVRSSVSTPALELHGSIHEH